MRSLTGFFKVESKNAIGLFLSHKEFQKMGVHPKNRRKCEFARDWHMARLGEHRSHFGIWQSKLHKNTTGA